MRVQHRHEAVDSDGLSIHGHRIGSSEVHSLNACLLLDFERLPGGQSLEVWDEATEGYDI
jgi:hypothetical protein